MFLSVHNYLMSNEKFGKMDARQLWFGNFWIIIVCIRKFIESIFSQTYAKQNLYETK